MDRAGERERERGWSPGKVAAGGTALLAVGAMAWALLAHADHHAAAPPAETDPAACAPFDHEHAAWSSLLARHVEDGAVDYAGLERSGEADLDAYLGALSSVCEGHFDGWSEEQRLAYWINAYNAFTVRLILDHYPLSSIRSIGLLPGAAFRESFIHLALHDDGAISLDHIEHQVLRKEFREPRIHFAIVCASESCPALRSEAYRAQDLDRQLDEAARGFIRDRTKNHFDAGTRTLHLSSIFDWFGEDFERAAPDLPTFVARYAAPKTRAALTAGSVDVKFLDYDWSLNGR